MGRKADDPRISGVLNIDKPAGMTSHDVVDAVRRIVGVRRVGHTGTLDPQATGVLPLCVGRATRIAQYLTRADKEYLITMRLGITTDTLDAAGRVLSEVTEIHVSRDDLQRVLEGFRGEIQQVPPLYSAKKVQGERLYRLARRGQVVERQPVTVRIYDLQLLSYESPLVRFRVTCSKGTYGRALCDDIGRALGCGAHLQSLIRTRSGRFEIQDALTLAGLEDRVRRGRLPEVLMPVGDALAHLPAVRVLPEAFRGILHGGGVPSAAVVAFPPGLGSGTLVRVLGYHRRLLSLAETALASEEFSPAEPQRVALKPVRVLAGV